VTDGPPSSLAEARERDAADPLRHFRARFAVPVRPDGQGGDEQVVYLCGNSLGLMPLEAERRVREVLDAWGGLAVDGHFAGRTPWYRYDEPIEALQAPLVGAAHDEVALGNSLTVDLHLLLASFYRPSGRRTRIVIEGNAFPSDRYAVAAQAAWHGLEPATTVVEVDPDPDGRLPPERFEEVLDRIGDEVALVLLGGVNYLSGELLDLPRIVGAARSAGAVVGLDLAHAIGNVPLRLHDWDVDFAAWCTYKYLNSGPGAVAGWFVHRRHGSDPLVPRLAGWWGNDPDRRFAMTVERRFVPRPGAAGWKVSNPPILALAPVGASLELFAEAGLDALRAKSTALTGDLLALLDDLPGIRVLTPSDAAARGCQVSIRVPDAARVHDALHAAGVVGDLRDPDVVRLSPAPLYNGWEDVWRAVVALRDAVRR
jgi:kynureninase